MNAEIAACSRLASLDPCGTFEDLAPVLPHIMALTRLVLDHCLNVTDRLCILFNLVIDRKRATVHVLRTAPHNADAPWCWTTASTYGSPFQNRAF